MEGTTTPTICPQCKEESMYTFHEGESGTGTAYACGNPLCNDKGNVLGPMVIGFPTYPQQQIAIKQFAAQKKAAEKVVRYEGLLDYDELKSLMKSCFAFICPGNPVELSISPLGGNPELWRVTISSNSKDHLPIGLFQEPQKNRWLKKFYQVSGPPLLQD